MLLTARASSAICAPDACALLHLAIVAQRRPVQLGSQNKGARISGPELGGRNKAQAMAIRKNTGDMINN